MAAPLHAPLRPLHGGSAAWACASGERSKCRRRPRVHRSAPLGDLLGQRAHEDDLHGKLLVARQLTGQVAQQGRGPRAGRAGDRDTRPAPEGQVLERLWSVEPSRGKDRCEVREPGPLLGGLRVRPVHALDPDQRRMPLVAPGPPGRAAQLVAGAQLAAPDLGRRDVHVVARLAGRVHSNEAAAVRQHVQDAGGDLLVGDLVLDDLRLLLTGWRSPPAAPAAAAAPRGLLESLLGRDLVRLVLGRALRSALGSALRRPSDVSSDVPSEVSSSSSSRSATTTASPAGSPPPVAPRMAPIRSSLRIAR